MSQSSEHYSTDHKHALKGTEVFVGGLPRTISEDEIRKEFSACGEIVEIRMIKDQKGNLKGFCFVRFSTKEAAGRAVREKSGTVLDGKKIGVLPSTEQDTLYFGNLNKAWSADEFEKIVLQVFPDVVSIDLAMLKDMQLVQKQRNRGFAFVKFSSHAAAGRAHRVGSQPDFRLGNLHPVVQWAEEEPEIDPKELAKIKIAFVRNLPMNADENFLKHIFEPFGKVEKVVISKKGSSPVGFVHFTERSNLDRAIKGMNEKTIQGPSGGPHKLQVEIARPMDRNKKRASEDSDSNSVVQGHSKLFKVEPNVAPSSIPNSHVQRLELLSADPYEDAVIALPLPIKERLLRIMRLGIATRFDIDVKTLCRLKQLPDSIAISVLDQFMLSGAASQHKGAYLAGLISKYLVDKSELSQSLVSLSKVADTTAKESKLFSISHPEFPPPVGTFAAHTNSSVARSDIYASHYSSPLYGYPLSNRAVIGRVEEKGSEFHLPSRTLLPGSQGIQIPRIGTLEEISHSPFESSSGTSLPYGRVGLRKEERHVSPLRAAPSSSTAHARLGLSLSSDITAGADRQAPRPQVRFDPFTGQPYKFDPFTGEPILPGSRF